MSSGELSDRSKVYTSLPSPTINIENKSIHQIAVQHNYLLNKFTSVEATCFGSYQRTIRPYTISKPESEEVL
jgi:hypothetical protein